MFTFNHPLRGIIIEATVYVVFFVCVAIGCGFATAAIYKRYISPLSAVSTAGARLCEAKSYPVPIQCDHDSVIAVADHKNNISDGGSYVYGMPIMATPWYVWTIFGGIVGLYIVYMLIIAGCKRGYHAKV